MSYKYDKENGYRNADIIGADKDEFNQELSNMIDSVKRASNAREAINVVSCEEKRRELNKKIERQENENIQNITMTNPNLVSDIQKDIESEMLKEQEIENITITRNQAEQEDEREAI